MPNINSSAHLNTFFLSPDKKMDPEKKPIEKIDSFRTLLFSVSYVSCWFLGIRSPKNVVNGLYPMLQVIGAVFLNLHRGSPANYSLPMEFPQNPAEMADVQRFRLMSKGSG